MTTPGQGIAYSLAALTMGQAKRVAARIDAAIMAARKDQCERDCKAVEDLGTGLQSYHYTESIKKRFAKDFPQSGATT